MGRVGAGGGSVRGVMNNNYPQGSVPEREQDKLFNTCTVFGPEGELLGKYRKVLLIISSIRCN